MTLLPHTNYNSLHQLSIMWTSSFVTTEKHRKWMEGSEIWNVKISISSTTTIDNIPSPEGYNILLLNMLDKISIIDKHVPSFLCKEAPECSGRGLLSPSWCRKSPGCLGRGFLSPSCFKEAPGCSGWGFLSPSCFKEAPGCPGRGYG